MHVDPNIAALAAVTCGIGYLMTVVGLGKGALEAALYSGAVGVLLIGIFLVFSSGVILMNLVADLIYPLIDPRVRRA